jgi:hypothetical protein
VFFSSPLDSWFGLSAIDQDSLLLANYCLAVISSPMWSFILQRFDYGSLAS